MECLRLTNPWRKGGSDDAWDDWDDEELPDGDAVADGLLAVFRAMPGYRREES